MKRTATIALAALAAFVFVLRKGLKGSASR